MPIRRGIYRDDFGTNFGAGILSGIEFGKQLYLENERQKKDMETLAKRNEYAVQQYRMQLADQIEEEDKKRTLWHGIVNSVEWKEDKHFDLTARLIDAGEYDLAKEFVKGNELNTDIKGWLDQLEEQVTSKALSHPKGRAGLSPVEQIIFDNKYDFDAKQSTGKTETTESERYREQIRQTRIKVDSGALKWQDVPQDIKLEILKEDKAMSELTTPGEIKVSESTISRATSEAQWQGRNPEERRQIRDEQISNVKSELAKQQPEPVDTMKYVNKSKQSEKEKTGLQNDAGDTLSNLALDLKDMMGAGKKPTYQQLKRSRDLFGQRADSAFNAVFPDHYRTLLQEEEEEKKKRYGL